MLLVLRRRRRELLREIREGISEFYRERSATGEASESADEVMPSTHGIGTLKIEQAQRETAGHTVEARRQKEEENDGGTSDGS
ncbi:MAG: hypothetical protein HY726_09320 [Candidatus Rokubacteria bacterium]|nr:hypothetical protein [Candidatus Rokubacteria bacterium]